MANEFIARNGIISKGNVVVTGSINTTGNTTFTGSMYITGSLGIGTNVPTGGLDVRDVVSFGDVKAYNSIQLVQSYNNPTVQSWIWTANNGQLNLGTGSVGAGNTIMTLSGSRVGIGITSPVSLLQLQSGDLTLSKTAIGSTTEVANISFRNDYMGPYTWAQIKGVNGSSHDFSNLTFSTTHGFNSVSEKVRITSDGYLRLATKGIQFNADTSDANSLDDYEEGTFTPSVNLLGTISYNTRLGFYTKIGNIVNFTIFLVLSSNNSTQDATAYNISGLPFTANNPNGTISPFAMACTEQIYKTSSLIGTYFQVSVNNTAGTLIQNSWNNELVNKTYYSSVTRAGYSGGTQYINISGFYYTTA